MDERDLLRKIRDRGCVNFVNENLFNDFAWLCPTRSGHDYEFVREGYSSIFNNHPSDIAIVGSAKYGFSLSPTKRFKRFQADDEFPDVSDVDLVVVSKSIFNETWRHLRRAHYNGAIDAKKLSEGDIFRRFITVGTNHLTSTVYLKDLTTLLNEVRKLSTTKFGITQTVKLRIYCSWADAKSYHVWSLQKLGEEHGIQ